VSGQSREGDGDAAADTDDDGDHAVDESDSQRSQRRSI
jgi:hypothetical protein